jgi:hypothetical protein
MITIEQAQEFFESNKIKIHDCNNNTTIFNTRKWVELNSVTKIMQQFAQMQVDKAVEEYKKKVKKLEFMIKEGLGYEDLINDI